MAAKRQTGQYKEQSRHWRFNSWGDVVMVTKLEYYKGLIDRISLTLFIPATVWVTYYAYIGNVTKYLFSKYLFFVSLTLYIMSYVLYHSLNTSNGGGGS